VGGQYYIFLHLQKSFAREFFQENQDTNVFALYSHIIYVLTAKSAGFLYLQWTAILCAFCDPFYCDGLRMPYIYYIVYRTFDDIMLYVLYILLYARTKIIKTTRFSTRDFGPPSSSVTIYENMDRGENRLFCFLYYVLRDVDNII